MGVAFLMLFFFRVQYVNELRWDFLNSLRSATFLFKNLEGLCAW